MKRLRSLWKTSSNELTLLVMLLVLFAAMAIISPGRFLTPGNIQSMGFQMAEFGFFSLGMMAIILTGGINLAIVAQGAIASILGAYILTQPFAKENPVLGILLALAAMLAAAALTGAVNGGFVAFVGVSPILVTLGTMTLFNGFSLLLTRGSPISGFPSVYSQIGNGSIGPFPIPLLLYALGAAATYFVLERSAFGTRLYMIGCNERASRFSAVNTRKVLMQVYVFCGLMAGIAGIIMSSRYNSAKMDYGSSYQMQSIAAVVLGGTRISGGQGTVAGTVIAVCIIQVVSNGLNIMGISRYGVDIINGCILLVVLTLRFLTQRGGRAVKKAAAGA